MMPILAMLTHDAAVIGKRPRSPGGALMKFDRLAPVAISCQPGSYLPGRSAVTLLYSETMPGQCGVLELSDARVAVTATPPSCSRRLGWDADAADAGRLAVELVRQIDQVCECKLHFGHDGTGP